MVLDYNKFSEVTGPEILRLSKRSSETESLSASVRGNLVLSQMLEAEGAAVAKGTLLLPPQTAHPDR